MATAEIRDLRHRYKAAYTTYLSCVQALSDASQRGAWPAPDILGSEERAFNELSFVRQALLAALFEHSRQAAKACTNT